MGSYERGDRGHDGAEAGRLLRRSGGRAASRGPVPSGAEPATKVVINLERLQQLPAEKVGPLARYAAAIQSLCPGRAGTIDSSAAAGHPTSPSPAAIWPSCACALAVSRDPRRAGRSRHPARRRTPRPGVSAASRARTPRRRRTSAASGGGATAPGCRRTMRVAVGRWFREPSRLPSNRASRADRRPVRQRPYACQGRIDAAHWANTGRTLGAAPLPGEQGGGRRDGNVK